jgi:hypothetical protein
VGGPSRHAMWLSLRAVNLMLSKGAGSQVPSPADAAATAPLAGQPAVSTPSQVAHQCVRYFPFPSPPFGPGTNLSITLPPDSQMAWDHHPHDRKPAHPASTCTPFSPAPGYTTLPSLTTRPSHPPHPQSSISHSTLATPVTLAQPAIEPPIPASSRLVLRSPKLPLVVAVGPIGSPPSFFIGKDGEKRKAKSFAVFTNFDELYAVHSTLVTCFTPEEWHSLSEGFNSNFIQFT